MVNQSAVIVHATITSAVPQFIDDIECGTRYTATVLTSFRQAPQKNAPQEITFGRWPGLEVGRSYVLFLNQVSDTDFYRIWLSNIPEPEERLMAVARCNGLAPGLETDRSEWSVVGDKVEIRGVLPHPWPNAIPVHRRIEPPASVVSRDTLFARLQQAPTIEHRPQRVYAGSRYRTLDEMVRQTPLILHVHVLSAEGLFPYPACPQIIKATILRKLKGPAPLTQSGTFVFHDGADELKPGRTYLLFMQSSHRVELYESPIRFRQQSGADWAQRIVKCGPFQFQADIAWEVAKDTVEIGESPSAWPTTVPVMRPKNSRSELAAREELFSYIEQSAADRVR